MFPALSVHAPATDARSLSGPPYWEAAEQDATPEVPSVPEYATVSARLYQPLASGCLSGAAVTDGIVRSSLIVTDFETEEPSVSFQAVQVSFVPGVSTVSVLVSQPSVRSAPLQVQLTVTLLRYQPFVPWVPTIVTLTSTCVTAPAVGTSTKTARSAPAKTVRRKILRRTLRRSNPGLTLNYLPPVAWWCCSDATPGAEECQSPTEVSGRGRRRRPRPSSVTGRPRARPTPSSATRVPDRPGTAGSSRTRPFGPSRPCSSHARSSPTPAPTRTVRRRRSSRGRRGRTRSTAGCRRRSRSPAPT